MMFSMTTDGKQIEVSTENGEIKFLLVNTQGERSVTHFNAMSAAALIAAFKTALAGIKTGQSK